MKRRGKIQGWGRNFSLANWIEYVCDSCSNRKAFESWKKRIFWKSNEQLKKKLRVRNQTQLVLGFSRFQFKNIIFQVIYFFFGAHFLHYFLKRVQVISKGIGFAPGMFVDWKCPSFNEEMIEWDSCSNCSSFWVMNPNFKKSNCIFFSNSSTIISLSSASVDDLAHWERLWKKRKRERGKEEKRKKRKEGKKEGRRKEGKANEYCRSRASLFPLESSRICTILSCILFKDQAPFPNKKEKEGKKKGEREWK